MAENFSKLGKKQTQPQSAKRVPNQINPDGPTPQHMLTKIFKAKDKALQSSERKTTCQEQGAHLRLRQALQARGRGTVCPDSSAKRLPTLHYSVKASLRTGEKKFCRQAKAKGVQRN